MKENIAIKVDNITKTYNLYNNISDRLKEVLSLSRKSYHNKFDALSDVSFEIKNGETFGVIGGNGAGKSTLLKIISNVVLPTIGTVNVNGKIASLLELGAGFDSELTGFENIYLNGSLLGYSKTEVDQKIKEIIDFTDIGDFIHQPVKVYSSGMFVRLAFSTQMIIKPSILIVDEALSVGDAYFVHKCMLYFHKLKERGTTIILVTHDMTAIRTLCDSAIWLNKGNVEAQGSVTKVVDKYLQFITNQKQLKLTIDSKKHNNSKTSKPEENCYYEYIIPNIDDRVGDQGCSTVGFGLYDNKMKSNTSFQNNSIVNMKLSFENHNVDKEKELIIGYKLRNNKGVDIASSNTKVEKIIIHPPKIGEIKTVLISVKIPLLHPGSYSISVSIGYIKSNGVMRNLDSISNIEILNIESRKKIHVLMSLETDFIDQESTHGNIRLRT